MTEPDPAFTTRAELLAWTRQRLRYPDPEAEAQLRALQDIHRVHRAHAHLFQEDDA